MAGHRPRVSQAHLARQGRERAPRSRSTPRLAWASARTARTIGRPQRSNAWAVANTPPPRGSAPAPPVGLMRAEPESRRGHSGVRADIILSDPRRHAVAEPRATPSLRPVAMPFGVQGRSPCGGGVPATAQASKRCGLPAVWASREVEDARRGGKHHRGARSRPCQANSARRRAPRGIRTDTRPRPRGRRVGWRRQWSTDGSRRGICSF